MRARAALLLAEAREDAGHGLREREELLLGAELVEDLRLDRHGAEPTADHDVEAALPVAHLRDRAEVVERDEPARVLVTARERDLELAAEVERVGVPEQEGLHRLRVRRDVEALVVADARVLTGRHVADGVAARLARRDADRREPAEEIRRVLDVDEVQLDVLARRDVEDRVRVLLGELRDHVELRRRELPVRDLDPAHAGRVPEGVGTLRERALVRELLLSRAVVAEAVVVALAVGAAPQAGLGEHLVVDLARLLQLHLAFEDVDLAREVLGHRVAKPILPARGAHGLSWSTGRGRPRLPSIRRGGSARWRMYPANTTSGQVGIAAGISNRLKSRENNMPYFRLDWCGIGGNRAPWRAFGLATPGVDGLA